MTTFRKLLPSVLVWAGLVGCAEPSGASKHWAKVSGMVPRPAPTVPVESRTPANPVAPAPAATNEPAPAAPTPPTKVPPVPAVNDRVALDNWSKNNHFEAPQRLLSATNLTFELHTTNGVIALMAGSNLARFNGSACYLGHAPRYSDGRFVIHVLDAEKSLRPLACLAKPRLPPDSIVVIDAGHGGENAGPRCAIDNHFEKDFTLDWALRLKTLLATNGWNVVLTRTNDVDVSLAERVAQAERFKAALFVSLHFNSASPNHGQPGIETFCLTPVGLPSTLARDYDDDPSRVFPNNAYDDQNLLHAVRMHRALLEMTGA